MNLYSNDGKIVLDAVNISESNIFITFQTYDSIQLQPSLEFGALWTVDGLVYVLSHVETDRDYDTIEDITSRHPRQILRSVLTKLTFYKEPYNDFAKKVGTHLPEPVSDTEKPIAMKSWHLQLSND